MTPLEFFERMVEVHEQYGRAGYAADIRANLQALLRGEISQSDVPRLPDDETRSTEGL